jgi:hypothetical protein
MPAHPPVATASAIEASSPTSSASTPQAKGEGEGELVVPSRITSV